SQGETVLGPDQRVAPVGPHLGQNATNDGPLAAGHADVEGPVYRLDQVPRPGPTERFPLLGGHRIIGDAASPGTLLLAAMIAIGHVVGWVGERHLAGSAVEEPTDIIVARTIPAEETMGTE